MEYILELYSLKEVSKFSRLEGTSTGTLHCMRVIDPVWPYPSSVTDAPRLHSIVLPADTSSASHSQRTKRSSSVQGVKINRLPPNP
ncbi:hypothetical protein TNCV_3201081 [Trichonephila clavipes]|nr:hypothetical protein TNCV_3201081 [Trichonephila clavipes]